MSSYFAVLPALSVILCVLLSIVTLRKNSRNIANIGFALGLASIAAIEAGGVLVCLSSDLRLTGVKAMFLGQAFLPAAWLLFSGTFGRGGRPDFSGNRLFLLLAASGVGVLFLAIFVFKPFTPLFAAEPGILGGGGDTIALGAAGRYLYIFLILGVVANLVQLENTFRSSTGIKRWQIKYVIFGVGSILTFFIYQSTQAILFSAVEIRLLPVRSSVVIIALAMMAVFIVKHRLFDIDIFVSRYFVYNSITVFAVGLYLVAVGLVMQGISMLRLPYGEFFSAIVVFISILALVVLLFTTALRRKVQLFINRNFYKHKYEFRDKWMETVARITPQRTIEDVLSVLSGFVSSSLCPSSVHIWVFDPVSKGYRSEALNPDEGRRTIPGGHPILRFLTERMRPFGLPEAEGIPGEREIKELFVSNEAVLCAPLIALDELIGFMLIGRDVSGEEYRQDDFELITAINTQAAVQIKNIRLANELMAARETEAFSKMSAFIMHDLKNLTNSLSLMSQNAKYNIENPEFQKDMVKTIDGTVSRMKRLINRLSSIPGEMELKKESVDLNALLDAVLKRLVPPSDKDITVVREVSEIPPIFVDPEAIEMVFYNLVTNAYEVISGRGAVRVTTSFDGTYVFVAISDNGPGMTVEFMENALFKPFRTTKKKGFGIGLYQCKAVVEAHGGSISVASEKGKGASFTLRFPSELVVPAAHIKHTKASNVQT